MRTLARISVAPVKGFRLAHPEHVTLTSEGVVENRRFFLVNEHGARLRSSLTEPVTLVSEASVARLTREAGVPVDARRFRMLLELSGCGEHEEDTWDGRRLVVGDAVMRVGGPVDRCAVTTRDPETGERDLDTLRLIAGYRGRPRGSIDFGVYAQVEQPGVVRVGDPVVLA